MEKVIEVKNLVKVYGKRSAAFTALKSINLDIYEGESVAIIGKSGSGKSTLMHLLALLDKPTAGTIKINGVDSTKLRSRKLNQLRNRSFGFVFQQFFMNPNDTVLENAILPLKIAGTRRKRRKELATKALRTVGLEERLKFKANDLSGGQKQRVCIARALVNNPSIIFADEPTGNLDSATGDKIIKLLFDANEKGTTLIIVTHDEDLAKLCNRQVRIMDGKIVEDTGAKTTAKSAATKSTGTKATSVKTSSSTKTTTSKKPAESKASKTAKAVKKSAAKTTKSQTTPKTSAKTTKTTKKGTK